MNKWATTIPAVMMAETVDAAATELHRRLRGLLEPAAILLLAFGLQFWRISEIPPGLDEDSAANGWLAVQWLRGGPFPFWNGRNGAVEPIMVALQTATTALWGPSVFALRSVSAAVLALAAWAVYAVAWEMGRAFSPAMQRWGARFAAVALATSPVMLELGRTGLRATLLPLAVGLLLLVLLYAVRTGRRRFFALAGLVLGIAAYTYLAARLLPVAVGIFLVVRLWMGFPDPAARRRFLVNCAFLIGLAFVVALPQLGFLAAHPDAFWARVGAVTMAQNPLTEQVGYHGVFTQKTIYLARLFGLEWWGQYNQAARPLLSPLAFVGFLAAGWLGWRARHVVGMQALWIFLPVMLIPDLVGGDRLEPHSLRVIGVLLPAFALSGLGLAWLAQMMQARSVHLIRSRGRFVRAPVLGGALLLGLALWGAVDWLVVIQPRLAQSDYSWYAREDVALANWINAQPEPMLIPIYELSRPNVAYLTAARAGPPQGGLVLDPARLQAEETALHDQGEGPLSRQPRVFDGVGFDGVGFDGVESAWLVVPVPPPRPRVEASSYRYDPAMLALLVYGRAWLLPPIAPARLDTAVAACAEAQAIFVDARPVAHACRIRVEPTDWAVSALAPASELPGGYHFHNNLQVVWAEADTSILPGDAVGELAGGMTVGLNGYWQAEQSHNRAWRMFVHILDDNAVRVAGEDFMPAYGLYGTEMWQPGALIPLRQTVTLPNDLAPGRYWLAVGLYDPLRGERSPVWAANLDTRVQQARFGPLKVVLPRPSWAGAHPAAVALGPELVLTAYDLTVTRREGAPIHVTVGLQVETLAPPSQDYTFFLHVIDAQGILVAQHDTQPLAQPRGSTYPTGIWSPGEVVVIELTARLAPDMIETERDTAELDGSAAGFELWVGAYVGETGQRLSLAVSDNSPVGQRHVQTASAPNLTVPVSVEIGPLQIDADRLRLGRLLVRE